MKKDSSFWDSASVLLWGFLVKLKTEVIILFNLFAVFIAPISGLFILVALAVGTDTIFGIYSARKTKTYNSNNLFNIVVKTFFYELTILMAYFADIHILSGKLFEIPYFTSKLTCLFWLYIECKSIDEKSQKLGNKPFLETITSLIKLVKNVKKDINEIKE